MVPVVLDSSIAVSWFFEDTSTPITDEMLHRTRRHGAITTSYFTKDLLSMLQKAEELNIIDKSYALNCFMRVSDLPIWVERRDSSYNLRNIYKIAQKEKLPLSDAALLELALVYWLPIATLNERLVAACRNRKVLTFSR